MSKSHISQREGHRTVHVTVPLLLSVACVAMVSGAVYRPMDTDFGTTLSPDLGFWETDFPKIIHHVHFKGIYSATLDTHSIQTMKDSNKDYEFRLWSEEDVQMLISRDFKWFWYTYITYAYDIQRAKVAPFFILRKYGGVFVDKSLRSDKNLASVFNVHELSGTDCVVTRDPGSGISPDFMMCKERSPFLTFVTSRLHNSSQWIGLPYNTVEFTSGSAFLTACFNEYPDKKPVFIWPHVHFRDFFRSGDDVTWACWLGWWRAWMEPYRCSWLCWLLVALCLPMFSICCVCFAAVIAQRHNPIYYKVAYVKHH